MSCWGCAQVFLKDKFPKPEVLDQRLSTFDIFTDIAKEPPKKTPPTCYLQSPFKTLKLSDFLLAFEMSHHSNSWNGYHWYLLLDTNCIEQYFIFLRCFSKGHEDPKEFIDVLSSYTIASINFANTCETISREKMPKNFRTRVAKIRRKLKNK